MNVMGFQDRKSTLSELSAMQNMMHEAMTDGAVGLSTGLTYPPDVSIHLSHAQLAFPLNEGRGPELITMIDQDRAGGVNVTMDSYPYSAASTFLWVPLPSWAYRGGDETLLERLRDPVDRERLRHELEETGTDGAQGVSVDRSIIQLGSMEMPANRGFTGRRVNDVASELNRPPFDWVSDLLLQERLNSTMIWHQGSEANVRYIMKHPAHAAAILVS